MYVDFDLQFHLGIARATHNIMLLHLIESIQEASKVTIRKGLHLRQTREQLEHVQKCHEALLEEIINGNAEQAARVMAQQMDEPMELLASEPHLPESPGI